MRAAENWAEEPALVSKDDVTYTFKQYYENAKRYVVYGSVNFSFAKAAKTLGVKKSTCIGIIGFNSPEYFFTLQGTWLLGAVTVGIYTTNAPDACAYVLNHSESSICVCQGGAQARKIYGIRNELSNLKAIVVYWPDDGMPEDDGQGGAKVYRWDEFLATGCEVADEEIVADAKKVEPGSCATLIYTSGTTVGEG